MCKKNIFIVEATVAYEGSRVIRAFTTEVQAKAYCDKCNAYQEKYPELPPGDYPDAEWEKQDAKEKCWQRNHPAKGSMQCEDFTYTTCRLFD